MMHYRIENSNYFENKTKLILTTKFGELPYILLQNVHSFSLKVNPIKGYFWQKAKYEYTIEIKNKTFNSTMSMYDLESYQFIVNTLNKVL